MGFVSDIGISFWSFRDESFKRQITANYLVMLRDEFSVIDVLIMLPAFAGGKVSITFQG